MIRLDVAAFEQYATQMLIPSRDAGLIPFRVWGPQRYLAREFASALERDVHEFVVLKGARQVGGSTLMDALTLWWCQENAGTQGMVVSDEDDNAEYRRDVMLEMHASAPRAYKLQTLVNNRNMIRFPNGSRLSYKAAGVRSRAKLGRSRGLNFLYADEVGAWPDLRAVGALSASLSKHNPTRLYVYISTAQGIGTPFHDLCKAAEHVPSQKLIFLAWWMHELYQLIEPTDDSSPVERELWETYTARRPTGDERAWMAEIRRRYGVELTRGQIGWYRWVLEAEMHGDEALRAQEYSCLPEEAFQAFGEKVIRPELIRSLRAKPKPEPEGLRYEWGQTLDPSLGGTQVVACSTEEADLLVWEQPHAHGAYVVAGHPSWSSSPSAAEFVAQVWRAYPDALVQVAEYSGDSAMYQFAWTLLHLAGAYRTFVPAYFIMEVGGPGYRVLKEIQLIERHGYGLSAVPTKQQLQNVLGSMQHYYYQKPDQLSARPSAIEWRTGPNNRSWILHGLRDAVERGQLTIRSAALIDELAAMRRGEEGDNDIIEGGGGQSDARVMTAALAVECWLNSAMPDLLAAVQPRDVDPHAPRHTGEQLVQNYLSGILGVR